MMQQQFTSPYIDRPAKSAHRIADFRVLLGDDAWHRLPLAVRERFAFRSHATTTVYEGEMHVIASGFARALAHVWRLIGTPVTPFVGRNVPVSVHVTDLPDASGTVWERRYHFNGQPASIVRSIKQLDEDGTLIETLSAGLRMRLQVQEIEGAIHFISDGYFFRLGPLRFNIPNWFPPGLTCVVHEDKGNGRFRFMMRTSHPWFGDMFVQDGEFT
jgi:hypothetical protein